LPIPAIRLLQIVIPCLPLRGMLLWEIHCHNVIDSRLKRAGMTELRHFLVNLQQPTIRDVFKVNKLSLALIIVLANS
jgi:hypothetical protein